MKLSLCLLASLCYVGFALGRPYVTNQWTGGYQAKLQIPVNEATNGWKVELQFDQPIDSLQSWTSKIQSSDEGRKFVLTNESWNENLAAGSQLDLEFLVRYLGQSQPKITRATFNGQQIDIGNGSGSNGSSSSGSTGTSGSHSTGSTGHKSSGAAGHDSTSQKASSSSKAHATAGSCGAYDYGEVIGKSLLFYEAQRSGKLPSSNRIPWRGDSFLQDGKDNGVDLTGGYFDAGDFVKFGFPAAAMTTVMGWGLIDFKQGYQASGEYNNAKDALRWSLDYFMKAHTAPNELYGQVGDGNVDHSYWGRPEDWPADKARPSYKITASAPGSDLAGETAAAFATGYMVFKDSDPEYAAKCLKHAKELYDFANKYRGKYTDAIPNAQSFYASWSGYGDELGWAAAWLYRATGDKKYLQDVEKHWNEFGLGGRPSEFGWDDKKAGLQVLMAEITKDQKYVQAAQNFCNYVVNDVKKTPKGLAFLSQWGSNRYAANAAFVCLVAGESAGINTETYKKFAKSQINYMLGDSGRSYVVGYGKNPPTRPHHRASSCPNRPQACDTNIGANNPGPNPQQLTGALVGGPDDSDNFKDDRGDYVQSEVAIDYNAGFQSALAGLRQLC